MKKIIVTMVMLAMTVFALETSSEHVVKKIPTQLSAGTVSISNDKTFIIYYGLGTASPTAWLPLYPRTRVMFPDGETIWLKASKDFNMTTVIN